MITKIELKQILDFYDIPQLFLGEDIIGTKYLCLLFNDDEYPTYISVRISTILLNSFLGRKRDLRSILLNPEIKNEYFIVGFFDSYYHIESIDSEYVVEDMLPDEGYYFSGKEDDSLILQESHQYSCPVIHLGFEDPVNSHSIPVSTLSALTSQYQSMVANCYKKIDGTKHDSDFKLRVFSCSAASFNIHMYAESKFNLFGASRIDRTLQTLNGILGCSNKEELMDKLEPLKGHTIRSYKNFIRELVDNKITIKYKWVSSLHDGVVVSNKVEVSRLEVISDILNESSELEIEERVFIGIILSSSAINGKWTIKTENDEIFHGKTNTPDMLSGVVLCKVKYRLTCEESLEVNKFNAKEKIIFNLTGIETV